MTTTADDCKQWVEMIGRKEKKEVDNGALARTGCLCTIFDAMTEKRAQHECWTKSDDPVQSGCAVDQEIDSNGIAPG